LPKNNFILLIISCNFAILFSTGAFRMAKNNEIKEKNTLNAHGTATRNMV